MKRAIATSALLLASSVPAPAEKLSDAFRAEFQRTFRPGKTYAVVVQKGIPTTSVYGVEGKQTDAHYSIDVKDGRWKTSEGLLDTDQTAADFLSLGEVMELASISYKDNRVDLRMVSLEAHKVTRGNILFKNEKREPVATNFKFFFPVSKSKVMMPADVPEAVRYIQGCLRVFRDEASARAYAAQVQAGGAPAGPTTVKKEIKVGMSPDEVRQILGKPKEEVAFGDKTKWTYPDLTVIFESGKVTEVRF